MSKGLERAIADSLRAANHASKIGVGSSTASLGFFFTMSVLHEVQRAAQEIGLTPDQFMVLADSEAEAARKRILAAFVPTGHRRWWWENFKGAQREMPDGGGWKLPLAIAPDPEARVWFVVEDEDERTFPVVDTTVAHASMVLGECFASEYYIVAKDLSWLVCENHHNLVMAVGAPVEARLAAYADDVSMHSSPALS